MGDQDAAFVADARRRWKELLEKTDGMEAGKMALIVSLWATLNVDRLLDIAQRKVRP